MQRDLIEPYWNVKIAYKDCAAQQEEDLIEPYWNVKGNMLLVEKGGDS